MTPAHPAVLLVADDLSGAADSAAALADRARTAVALDADADWPDATVVAVDTDSRYLPQARAAARVAAVVRRAGPQTLVYKKIDSTLRGNIGPETAACLAALRERATGAGAPPPLAVVAPAFPATGRTVVGGRVLLHGRPVEEGHPSRVPLTRQLRAAGLRVAHLPAAGPARALPPLVGQVDAVVVDSETDADLAAVVRACLALPVLLVGSGGLAHHLTGFPPGQGAAPERPLPRPALVCAGSRSDMAHAQRETLLAGTGAVAVPVFADDAGRAAGVSGEPASHRVAAALRAGQDVVVHPDHTVPVDPARAPAVAEALAAAALAGLDTAGTLVATGGETARAVLHAGGVRSLRVVGEREPGVVELCTQDGLRVITKAGSFGDEGVLLRLLGGGAHAPRRPADAHLSAGPQQ